MRIVFNVNNDSQKLGHGHRKHKPQPQDQYVEARADGDPDQHSQALSCRQLVTEDSPEHLYFQSQKTESNANDANPKKEFCQRLGNANVS